MTTGDSMVPQLELAYLGIETPDPATLTPLLRDVVGLLPGEPAADGILTWRNDAAAHRLIVLPGPSNDAVFAGFEAVDDHAFDAVTAQLADAGFVVEDGSEPDRAARRVKRIARTVSPWGLPIEIVLGLEETSTPSSASPSVAGGFLTGELGFGHAVFATTAYDESHTFLVEGLGMLQTDWLELELMAGVDLEVRFYHCNARHHSVALARAPFELPQSLHHVMFETNDVDDVGAAFDRAWATHLTIANGLGRHDNDAMFSFYVTSPIGFQVEIGHGARVVSEPWLDNRRYDRISRWGHQPLAPRGNADQQGVPG